MARSEPSTRIGALERSAAQQALQEHLNAGRLHVNEYADRSAGAAEAMTVSELKVLFTDLPAPHPKLPGSPIGGARRNLMILAAVAVVLALGGVLAFLVGGLGGSAPTPAQALPTLNAAPTAAPVAPPAASTTPSSAASDDSAAPTAGALPAGVTERRTTDGMAITLRPSYGVDLDDDTSPNWGVSRGSFVRDVTLSGDASEVTIDSDYALMTGSPDYAACARETAYTSGSIERGTLQSGANLCVRTTDSRFALITIVSVSEQSLQFQATVWDPQIS